jgi:hypothetical protein
MDEQREKVLVVINGQLEWVAPDSPEALADAERKAKLKAGLPDSVPEPWVAEQGYDTLIMAANGSFAGSSPYRDRVIACVNACAGMDDPAAEIERLQCELTAFKEVARPQVAAAGDMLILSMHNEYLRETIGELVDNLTACINELGIHAIDKGMNPTKIESIIGYHAAITKAKAVLNG